MYFLRDLWNTSASQLRYAQYSSLISKLSLLFADMTYSLNFIVHSARAFGLFFDSVVRVGTGETTSKQKITSSPHN